MGEVRDMAPVVVLLDREVHAALRSWLEYVEERRAAGDRMRALVAAVAWESGWLDAELNGPTHEVVGVLREVARRVP